jgi:hypothetical protein
MFTPSTTISQLSAADARNIDGPGRRQRTLARRVGVLAAGALLAATLSVALPLQIHAVTQPDGHSTRQLSPTPDGTTALAFVVISGSKG